MAVLSSSSLAYRRGRRSSHSVRPGHDPHQFQWM